MLGMVLCLGIGFILLFTLVICVLLSGLGGL